MTDQATAYLRRADPILGALIDRLDGVELPDRSDRPKPGEHYASLVRTIVGQQLSTKAARSIWLRLIAHFADKPPTPQQVLAADPDELRAAAGLSRSKTTYLRSLAEHVIDGSLELERLEELDDDAVIAELVAVKGIGEWSAHMFLMFQLGRPDVIAPGDLGIRRGVQITYDLAQMPTPAEVVERAERWRPYRTAACMYLWRSIDAPPQ
ncbi:MAG TPA: DNA-3-methyladenine glycosylase 2 family protein [Solirubrobacteraceae bacterium]|nr:DNA-3-methyladenine glycosylase 2 family protein [Solirubrobacteraceae bacterium]